MQLFYKNKCSELNLEVRCTVGGGVIGRCLYGGLIGPVIGPGSLLGLMYELDCLGQAVNEVAEILTVEEYLMFLKTDLLVITLAADDLLALRDGQIHLILAGLAHIHVVDAFACLDGMREYHILLNIIGRLLPEILHKI